MDLKYFTAMFMGFPPFTKKSLNEMSPRIQRLIMKLQRYDFELIYTPGKQLALADALSRAPVMTHTSSIEQEIENQVNMIVESLPVSVVKTRQICVESAKDKELQTVMENLHSGWPKGSCPKYYHIRSELIVVNGLILREHKIVIPHILRPEIL